MSPAAGPALWKSPAFEEELRSWVAQVAGPVSSLERTKLRPWAAVWRAHTRAGVLYAKQNCPSQSFEAAVMAVLAEVAPTYVVPLVAVDRERGLLLTADQGEVFDLTVAAGDLAAWSRLVRRAMELSRAMQPVLDRLTVAGLTGCRVPDQRADLVRRLLDEVAPLGIGESLVHNDAHGRNAFDRPPGPVFFDFADAVVGHPLSGLMIPLSVLAHHLGGAGPEDRRLQRVADAGLEVWSDVAPVRELRTALPAALRLGALCRAESWARIIADVGAEALAEHGNAAEDWWGRLDDPAPVRFA